MAFLPPINMGSVKPAPATLAQWVYDIWQYLQENPIATQEDIATYIQNYFETSSEVQEIVGEVVAQYLLDNPPQAPVQSVQGKTGAVTLNYPDIVPASNAVPVYRAASAPNVSTAQGLYNNGYRLFVNTATQEIYTISNSGVLALVGRGKFDGTTVDLDTAQGDTTIAEAVTENSDNIGAINSTLSALSSSGTWTPSVQRATVSSSSGAWVRIGKIIILTGTITFGTSSDTNRIYISDASLPLNIGLKRPVAGVGRLSSLETNCTIVTANNFNLWIGNPVGLTGANVSGNTMTFVLVGTVA